MDVSYTIRPARTDDLPAVRTLLADANLPLDGLDEQFGESYAIALGQAGAVVGVEGIEVHGDSGLLRSAVVGGAYRGKGIGDALTRDRIAWARRRGLRDVYLLTTTAGEYFPRFGFVATDRDSAPEGIRRSREFADACPASALFMRLTLAKEARS
jgi:amino-acid N-acetyltransferase